MYLSMKMVFGSLLIISSMSTLIFVNMITDPLFLLESDDIILNKELYDSAPRDSVYINDVYIRNNHLLVNISYGGGCKDHNFTLIGSTEYLESYPIRTTLLLSHQSNNDTCLAMFTRILLFNLSPLKKDFQELYLEYTDTLLLRIEGGQEVFNLSYNL
ncbi:MAG: hypothetical protein ACW99F_15515 [Candidatus Hodarchaeales archaeon]